MARGNAEAILKQNEADLESLLKIQNSQADG